MKKKYSFFYVIFILTISINSFFVFNIINSQVSIPPTNLTLLQAEQKKKDDNLIKQIENIIKSTKKKKRKKSRRKKGSKKNIAKKITKKLEQQITNNAFLLEIRNEFEEQYKDPDLQKKITIIFNKMDIRDALKLISNVSGINLVVDSNVSGEVNDFSFEETETKSILSIILSNITPNLSLIKQDGVFRVMYSTGAFEIMKYRIYQKQNEETHLSTFIIKNTHWNESLKTRLNLLWQGIISEEINKKSFYTMFDDTTNKVFFRGRKHHVKEYKSCLEEIDKKIPQIRLEARIIVADKDFDEGFGVGWSGVYNRAGTAESKITTRGHDFVGVGIGKGEKENHDIFKDLLGWTVNFIPSKIAQGAIKIPFIFGNKDFSTKRLNLLLNAAESRQEIKTILKPTMLVSSSETAEILVGQELPQETRVNEVVEGQSTNITTISYKDIGMKIAVKPTVSPDNEAIFLEVFIQNSSVTPSPMNNLDKTTLNTNLRNFNYSIKTSRSKNKLILKSGQTTLISGLIVDSKEIYKTGVPLLETVPLLGWFFKGQYKRKKDEQMLIFLTPTLV